MTAISLPLKLSQVPVGAHSTIVSFADDAPRHVALRLQSLGFRTGNMILKIRVAPLGDPAVYRLLGYDMCVRNHEARHIQVMVTT